MEDYTKRIEDDDCSLGMGLIVTDFFFKEEENIVMRPIMDPKQLEGMYINEQWKELQTICNNENMKLVGCKYYFTVGNTETYNFKTFKVVLLKDLNFRKNEDSVPFLTSILSHLQKYLEIKIPPYFFIYLDKHTIIDEKGKFHYILETQNDFEYLEEFGEYAHEE